MRVRIVLIAVAGLAVAAGCSRQERPEAAPPRPDWLRDVPLIAGAALVDTTGTADAQHEVAVTAHAMDSVAAFYRVRLRTLGWKLMADHGDTASRSLYFVRNAYPLWINLEAQEGGTRLTFVAAGIAKPAAPTESRPR
jgi:hypothetical protein